MGKQGLILRDAAVVATMDDRGTELRGVSIRVDGPAIAEIGRVKGRGIDCRGKLVLPGLVNAHHHLFQVLTRNVPAVQEAPLFSWLTTLYGLWAKLTEPMEHAAASAGIAELLMSGCTTTSDHHYLFPPGRTKLIDAEVRAARELGIRFHPTRGSMSLGRSKGGLPPDEICENEDAIVADCKRVIEKFDDPARFSMCRVGVAPCAPFNVTPELMRRMTELGVPMHTHLAETTDEERDCLKRLKMTPIEFLASVGWTGPRVWLAHMVHVRSAEIEWIARQGIGVAHCPTSNWRLGSGRSPVAEMLRAGVAVGLGVDGSASNDSGNLLDEARHAMLSSRSWEPWVTARQALRMATRGGAKVLGRDDIGSIEVGKAADLVVLDLEGVATAGAMADPVAAALFCKPRVDTVIVNGRVVVEGGRLKSGDERAIARRANAASAQMRV